jgi:hypothetical protein
MLDRGFLSNLNISSFLASCNSNVGAFLRTVRPSATDFWSGYPNDINLLVKMVYPQGDIGY